MGIEPTALAWKAKVLPLYDIRKDAHGRNRTADTRIFSPLLYRLSYVGIIFIYLTYCKGKANSKANKKDYIIKKHACQHISKKN